MSFSAAKTVAIPLKVRLPGRDPILEVEGRRIRFGAVVRYLGFDIDRSRLYVEHVK